MKLWLLLRIMDKVDFPQGIEKLLNMGNLRPEARKTKGNRESRRTEFTQILEQSIFELGNLGPLPEINPSEEAAQGLLDEVHSRGNDLKRKPLPEELLQYKKAVRNLLHYVVENCYELQEVQGIVKKTVFRGKSEWRTTVFHQVQIVDKRLNQLAADIITRHIAELDLASRIDEITGLLVDLTITGKIRERDE